VLAEYEAAGTGEKRAVLRRKGLYSSHLVEWRSARGAAALGAPAPQGQARTKTPEQAEIGAEGWRRKPSGSTRLAR